MDWQILPRLAGTALIVAMLALPVFACAIVKESKPVAENAFRLIFVAVGSALAWGSMFALHRLWG